MGELAAATVAAHAVQRECEKLEALCPDGAGGGKVYGVAVDAELARHGLGDAAEAQASKRVAEAAEKAVLAEEFKAAAALTTARNRQSRYVAAAARRLAATEEEVRFFSEWVPNQSHCGVLLLRI